MSTESLLRATPETVLAEIDPASTPGWDRGKSKAVKALAAEVAQIGELQERLFAQSTAGDTRSVLLVLQGMDTSGKGGTVAHVFEGVDPHGIHIKSFKAPTAEERSHDFLWRVRPQAPGAGILGVFDRSHYEDVLIQRVRAMATPDVIESRYPAIVDFEAELAAAGTTIIKVMLHISPDAQKERLLARLDDPTKQWKFNPGDIDERALWAGYQEAYEIAIRRTTTEAAPWYVVPADHKWYSRLAVAEIVATHLRAMDLAWPAPDYIPAEQRARLS